MKKNPSQNLMRQYGALIALIILVVINCFTTKNFISVMTLWNLFTQATTVMILGLGMTIVIATGGINISVGSVLALSSMVLAKFILNGHIVMGVIASLAVAALTGAVTGVIVTKFKVQPMITTLAMMYTLRGIAKLMNGGTRLSYKNAAFSRFAYIKIGGCIPIQFAFIVILSLAIFILMRKTYFGNYVEAYGDNALATRISGINVVAVVTMCYVLCNVLACVAAIIETSSITCADPVNMGLNKETDAIAAVVVGGTPMSGGKPNIGGMLCGALVLQLITIMINMNNIPYSYSLIIKAAIIVVSLYVQNCRDKKV